MVTIQKPYFFIWGVVRGGRQVAAGEILKQRDYLFSQVLRGSSFARDYTVGHDKTSINFKDENTTNKFSNHKAMHLEMQ